MKDSPLDTRDSLTWKWSRGAHTDKVDFGNPLTGSTDYTICVYDEAAMIPTLVSSVTAAAGGTCNGSPCWKGTPRGYRYHERSFAPGGRLMVILNAGEDGKASVTVKAKGDQLQLPAPVSQSQFFNHSTNLTVQLVKSEAGPCWSAVYAAPATKNTAAQFKDRFP